jgi:hypothetical protein
VLLALCLVGLPLLAAAPAGAASGSRTDACPDVLVLGARGSGQSAVADQGLGPQVAALVARYRSRLQAGPRAVAVAARAVDYPAVDASFTSVVAGAYRRSVDAGAQRFRTLVDGTARRCGGTTALVLAGFSQGAHALLRALSGIGAGARARVEGVVLLASPVVAHDAAVTDFGDPGRWGVLGESSLPASWTGRVAAVCAAGDGVCHLGEGLHHGRYDAELLAGPAAWLARRTPAPDHGTSAARDSATAY